jgi:hypothetical protein
LQAKLPTFDLTSAELKGKQTFYEFMHSDNGLGAKMLEEAPKAQPSKTNDTILAKGGGISVKLGKKNYNMHINFPLKSTGGRSYGWSSGQVGDWSDAMYLDHLANVMAAKDAQDMSDMYKVIINMLGKSDSTGIDSLNPETQRVAGNFLAIYTAEEYRAFDKLQAPHKNWDDAIFQATMLAAFHAGQSKLTKFYLGLFSEQAKDQKTNEKNFDDRTGGVYDSTKPGEKYDNADIRDAKMDDYWQMSHDSTSVQSGINLTRVDFQLMGTAITKFEARNPHLKAILAIVKPGKKDAGNVYQALGSYFTEGNADISDADQLSTEVAAFQSDVLADAEKITKSIPLQQIPEKAADFKK